MARTKMTCHRISGRGPGSSGKPATKKRRGPTPSPPSSNASSRESSPSGSTLRKSLAALPMNGASAAHRAKTARGSGARRRRVVLTTLSKEIGRCVNDDEKSGAEDVAIPDDDNCPTCMDVPLYPVKLPCGHAYCFLCLKGEFLQRHGDAAEDEKVECGVCQTELLETLLEEPKQLKRTKSDLSDIGCGDMCWFYKDGADWWKYDKKSNFVLEEALEDKQKTIELSLLGRLYLIDLENKTQVKKGSDEAGSVKLIKRDQTSSACRGVAGLAYR